MLKNLVVMMVAVATFMSGWLLEVTPSTEEKIGPNEVLINYCLRRIEGSNEWECWAGALASSQHVWSLGGSSGTIYI